MTTLLTGLMLLFTLGLLAAFWYDLMRLADWLQCAARAGLYILFCAWVIK